MDDLRAFWRKDWSLFGVSRGSFGGVVAIQRRLMASDPYNGLSPYAKALMHLMHIHWSNDKPVGYGIREAERRIPCCRRTAMKAFRELQETGFIALIDESLFCSRIKSKTRTWRLTWLPFNSRTPTNDWENTDEN